MTRCLIMFGVSLLTACVSMPGEDSVSATAQKTQEPLLLSSYPLNSEADSIGDESLPAQSVDLTKQKALVQLGTGRFIDDSVALQRARHSVTKGGDITLQFKNTTISEVVRTVFGELLKQPYVISPKVKGSITFSTAKPIAKSQLRYVLETILSWNAAALVLREGIFHIVPISEAVPGQLAPSSGTLPDEPGYEVQIVPLKYISASEMQKLLKPFLTKTALLHLDDDRNLLILAGTRDQLLNYQRTIDIFDVDWLAGMSIGLFPLEVSEPIAIVEELKILLAEDRNPMASKITVKPMQRLNSVVVMTPLPKYLNKVREWIVQLDRQAGGSIEQTLFVYSVNNVDAIKLSSILSDVFSGSSSSSGASSGSGSTTRAPAVTGAVAPGLTPVEVTKKGVKRPQQPVNTKKRGADNIDFSSFQEAPITITAVEQNNSLLIKASPKQYKQVLRAIKQLDTAPLQVLIEATILEVTLTDGLSFGVEWFLNNAVDDFLAVGSAAGDGEGRVGSGGFSYRIGSGNLGVAISALETSGKSKLLSKPSLWALNNEEASINVGTQIPIITTSINTTGSADQITQVQYLDTGVILKTTPRIHPGGLVYLEVDLTISNPITAVGEGANPTVAQRTVKTKIAVNSGEAILLGGLISDNNNEGRSGVPWLSRAPIIKYLFGSNSQDTSRTEIIAVISPTVIYNKENAVNLMNEYREQFQYIYPKEEAVETVNESLIEPNIEEVDSKPDSKKINK